MTDERIRRQKLIAEIVREGGAASQEAVTARLAAAGLAVTQATVSRDLEQLGAVKVRRGGAMAYAMPDQIGGSDWSAGRFQHVMSEYVLSIEAAGPLIVMRTPPGSAHLVGVAIDQAGLPEIAGTVSGDDTIFLALRDGVVTDALAHRLRLLCFPEAS